MTEETAQPSSEPVAASATNEPSLDSVYKEQYGVEEQAASFQPQSPQPVAQPAPQAFRAPDPFDPNFGAYQNQMANSVMSLNQALSQTRNEIGTLRQTLNSERVEADIKRTVSSIAEKSGLDPKFAEVAFQLKAKENPQLLRIWNDRGSNPKALEKAIEVVSREFKQTYSVKQDPQLVENQRAVSASRNSMATTAKTSQQDEWESMTPTDRQAKVRLMMSRG